MKNTGAARKVDELGLVVFETADFDEETGNFEEIKSACITEWENQKI